MFSGDFRRSSRFGLIGVFVAAAVAAVVGLTMGEGESNPKLALALIFGVLGIFVVVLLLLQRADLEHAAGSDATARDRAAAEGAHSVEDPTALGEAELWASMAMAPIDADAVKAQSEMWQGHARLDRAMKPLGLQVTARPQGGFEPRGPTMPGFGYRLRGVTELSGERYGRPVAVRFGGHEDTGHSEVAVAVPCRPYEVESQRVTVRSGPEGLVVARRKATPGDWLCDLWVAEHLLAD